MSRLDAWGFQVGSQSHYDQQQADARQAEAEYQQTLQSEPRRSFVVVRQGTDGPRVGEVLWKYEAGSSGDGLEYLLREGAPRTFVTTQRDRRPEPDGYVYALVESLP